ncbi:hypothetical protein Hypma_014199 [Hypsizygus marmoreus]|uniref:Uncharacterized protein n=1 Tax=Hypsizygus marmoreus TaxID=39966 RepID=A0A369JF07_HYPMA|nr:hypothetical protein Hypma_014199 [Hypsizygus marmoreus]
MERFFRTGEMYCTGSSNLRSIQNMFAHVNDYSKMVRLLFDVRLYTTLHLPTYHRTILFNGWKVFSYWRNVLYRSNLRSNPNTFARPNDY